MQAILEDMQSGAVDVYEVPEPELRPGGILVRTHFSAISAGTERNKVEQSSKSIVGKAMARPDLVRQVLDYAKSNGVRAAYQKVQSRLQSLSTMGYSCAGSVLAVGDGVTEFNVGDLVACGGGGYANHCEVNWVPQNLAARVPAGVSLQAASLTTIGAIAMQGVRQAGVNFGETVVVIGAGLVGVLVIQLARTAGCRVIAVDVNAERAQKAVSLGAHVGLAASDPRLQTAVQEFSRYGPDAAIITAATSSAEPVELAAKILRDRGRIVIVGDVGMGVSRSNMYHKELSLVMSRSYGPGRYDHAYEEEGQDYPVGYVRWSEKRNMEAFLDFLALGSLDVEPLLEQRYPAESASAAYQQIRSGRGYTAILEYPLKESKAPDIASVAPLNRPGKIDGDLVVGCIGAGGFARAHIFPNLKAAPKLKLESVATASGVAAESARRSFGFTRAQTPGELLQNPDLHAIFILTKHESHAGYVTQALDQNKAVFVEKPLAINARQLEEIDESYRRSLARGSSPFLMVGFNRRFAPATNAIRQFFVARKEPMLVHVRVNAGYLPLEHWAQHSSEGGRVIGEMCHFVDWARSVVGQPIQKVSALALPSGTRYNRDNVAASLYFADGSIANLLYLANGDPAVPKEHFEVFCEGAVARLEDFRILELVRGRKIQRTKSAQDKGHKHELEATLAAMASGKPSPIPFDELREVTDTTFCIERSVSSGEALPVTTPLSAEVLTGS
jgi:predicted dehydrogenase/threonine dehydrogenase-like Zn-dependent dehydrogenase